MHFGFFEFISIGKEKETCLPTPPLMDQIKQNIDYTYPTALYETPES